MGTNEIEELTREMEADLARSRACNGAAAELGENEEPDIAFWNQRPILKHIHAFARYRMVSPYATLGCVLRRAISCVEPNVMLPPTVGGAVSVNLYTTTLGVSGAGKGGSEAAGRDAVLFPDNVNGGYRDGVARNPGTGEGLARLFKGRGDEEGTTRAMITAPEVSTLASIFDRQGSSLAGQLLQAYMGEALGFDNAHKNTTSAVEEHAYRLCLGVGTQVENAGFFLQREKDGFPQRFLWLSALDPYAPPPVEDEEEEEPPVEPLTVNIPDFGTAVRHVSIPRVARTAIRMHRHLVRIGSPDVDPLDGHLMLTRLKVAFGLAVLDERKDISDDDWRVAGQLIVVSTRVRAEVRAAVEERRRRTNRARAHDQAEREEIVAERLLEGKQQRVAKSVLRKLSKGGHVTRRELRHTLDSSVRSELDPVLEILLEQRQVMLSPGESRDGDAFGLAGV
jgi:hypothetical protein